MDSAQLELALQELKAGKEDLRPSDVLSFSEPLRSVLNQAVRDSFISLTELADRLEIARDQAKRIADVLVERHLFTTSSFSNDRETYYEVRLSAMTRPMRRPPPELWKKMDK